MTLRDQTMTTSHDVCLTPLWLVAVPSWHDLRWFRRSWHRSDLTCPTRPGR